MESSIAGDGCFQNSLTAQSPTVWNTGVWGQSEYGIRHGVDGIRIYDTGNTTISGNADVGGIMNTTKIKLTNDVWDNFPLSITSNGDNWFEENV